MRILDPKIREKISIVYDLNDADYVIDNHRKKCSSTPGEENLEKNFSIIYSLIVDGNIINTVDLVEDVIENLIALLNTKLNK